MSDVSATAEAIRLEEAAFAKGYALGRKQGRAEGIKACTDSLIDYVKHGWPTKEGAQTLTDTALRLLGELE